MKKYFFTSLLFLLSILTMSAQTSNNKYDKEWEEVTKLEEESLPQSATEKVNIILDRAIADKNTTQAIKAYLYIHKYAAAIDIENRGTIFQDFQKLLNTTDQEQEKALLHSMLAELYMSYYQADSWNINQRTNLSDFVPEDMKEWSPNIFKEKVISHLKLSLDNGEKLKRYRSKDYYDIIKLGTVSDKYYPTLYDFLMVRAIEVSKGLVRMQNQEFDLSQVNLKAENIAVPADGYIKLDIKSGDDNRFVIFQFYSDYLKDLRDRSLLPSIIMTDIDRVSFLADLSNSFSDEEVTNSYIKLYEEYKKDETSVEIIAKIVDSFNHTDEGESVRNERIYNWLTKGINEYPDYYAINILKERLNSLEKPQLNIVGADLYYPDKKMELSIIHQNIQNAATQPNFNLYKIDNGTYSLIKNYAFNLVSEKTYNPDTLKVSLDKLPIGRYVFSPLSKDELKDVKNKNEYNQSRQNRLDFIVSRLSSFSRNSSKNEFEIFVVDYLTGKPVESVTVKIYTDNYNEEARLLSTLKTNSLGQVIYKKDTENKDNIAYEVALGNDSTLKRERLFAQDYKWNVQNTTQENLLTSTVLIDRNIYRPGQTVYFKAIVLGKDSSVVTNKQVTAKLYNANREVVSEKMLRTNEFGSVSDNFVLPKIGLLGSYSLEVERGTVYFKVEEYKRPTFEITFDKIEKTYTFGEEVTIKGFAKNFSGISLQDANVEYSISREQFSLWPWRSGSKTHIKNDVVKTKEDGSFEISFTPESGDGNSPLFRRKSKNLYVFSISASVTDVNGETQSNTFSLTVGDVSMVINIDIPEQIEKTSEYKFEITAQNLQSKEIESSGTYTLYKLNDEDSIQGKALNGTFTTGSQKEIAERMKALLSGKYKLEVKAYDDKKNEIVEDKNVVLYSYKDKKPPIKTHEWLIEKNTKFGNKPVEIIYGTTDKPAYILYQLTNNEKIFESRFIKLNDSNHTFTIPYKEEYGDGITMSLTSVREGELYNQSISLSKEEQQKDSKLNVKLEVFRDKLRPGEEEIWTISVKDTTSNAVSAEILASMYDTSLDKLYPYTAWNLHYPQIYKEYVYPVFFQFARYDKNVFKYFRLDIKKDGLQKIDRSIDIINWYGYMGYYRGNTRLSGGLFSDNSGVVGGSEYLNGYQKKVSVVGSATVLREAAVVTKSSANIMLRGVNSAESDKVSLATGSVAHFDEAPVMPEAGTEQAPQIRQNFAETAFFYPSLRTNEKGETLITFTVPESNTTWRFRALAHDKEGKVGALEKMVLSQKELMVTPNMPRFVRQGDKTSISTKISNLSEKQLSGEVTIEFFDPTTEELINLNFSNQKQIFSLEKEASTSVNWTFDVPENIEMIGCRIVAGNNEFSDGEQHVLAVLSNRMLVTESLPIDMPKAGSKTFVLDKLYNKKSASLENYKLTLEYAANPAWYAVQALPVVSNPTNENAVNWFASYYVNTLGASIVKQYPKVAAMIKNWESRGGNEQTLLSKLNKNEELKTVLLEETPWVLDAQTEEDQMQRLSLLFDLNNSRQLTDVATAKLKELQNNTGGWSWYKDMYPSRSITQYILYGYAKLQLVGQIEYSESIKRMQMDALKYIDSKILEDFNQLKKNNKDWEKITSVSTNQLEFAYVRSFYRDIPISQETREAERFYTTVASKNWTKLGLYERAILSIVLNRNGEKELANKIVKSIREHAVQNDRLGMYWPNNRGNVFMSMSAVSTHLFLMEALLENGASESEMDAMKRWLLAQKKTQIWESTHATIDAISMLLSTGSDWFSGESNSSIKIGNIVVDPGNKETGSGYFKQVWNKSEIDNQMGKVEIETSKPTPSYGALYWQYYEDLDKIEQQKGDLNIEKQLFKEEKSNTGKELVLVKDGSTLEVGDKVMIRLTVRVDRNMEFVHIKDMRASCFEPEQTISGIKWTNGLIYCQTPKDASTNYYFDHLPKGTYVLEYPVYVNRSGEYSNGITTIQCLYAPEYISHTKGINIIVKDKQ